MTDKSANNPLESLRKLGREFIAYALIKKYTDPVKIVLHPWRDDETNHASLPRQGLRADFDDSQEV